MKLRIDKIAFTTLLLLIVSVKIVAQSLVVQNPEEWIIYEAGENALSTLYNQEISDQRETALLENTIAVEFSQIKSWEKSYTKYLQDVSGYASSLKAASSLMDDGVRILLNLGNIVKAVNSNSGGVIATLSLNNIYLETITEFLSCYRLLNDAIAEGGKDNMLSSYERSSLLWLLEDKMDSISKKLGKIYYSIKMYTLTDVWNKATLGMIERDNAQIAHDALSRWKRACNY